MIKVGIDFDNTIVCYDNVFYYAALEKELNSKRSSQNQNKVLETI